MLLNPKEAEMALAQMEKTMLILLKASRTVRLGDWATIRVTIRTRGWIQRRNVARRR